MGDTIISASQTRYMKVAIDIVPVDDRPPIIPGHPHLLSLLDFSVIFSSSLSTRLMTLTSVSPPLEKTEKATLTLFLATDALLDPPLLPKENLHAKSRFLNSPQVSILELRDSLQGVRDLRIDVPLADLQRQHVSVLSVDECQDDRFEHYHVHDRARQHEHHQDRVVAWIGQHQIWRVVPCLQHEECREDLLETSVAKGVELEGVVDRAAVVWLRKGTESCYGACVGQDGDY